MDEKKIALSATFATLYAVAVIVFAVVSFSIIQMRIADCLIPLSAVFGWPAIFGVTIGCFVGNAYAPVGWADYFLGPLANFIAAFLIFKLRRRPLVGCILGAAVVGLIVGGYLWLFLPVPEFFGVEKLYPWLISVISIFVSGLITQGVLGYSLLKIFRRPNIAGVLKAHGLKNYAEEK
ncbi:MAG TPA: QueT transporter family protein [archaeon]|nr:QueT transporter family protein [archaeon]